MASGLELLLVFVALEVDESWEQEDHVAAFVHDGAVAEVAAHFAGKLVLDRLVGRIVPGGCVSFVLDLFAAG